MPNSNSFTIKHGGIVREIRTDCYVFDAFDPANPPNPPPVGHQCIGLWDTGATQTAISQKLVDALGLVPTGMTRVNTANGVSTTPTYLVNIGLPNGVGFHGLTVTKATLPAHFDVLVGMDIIGSGDFAISNHNGITAFTYRHPASKCVDFVVEHKSDAFKEAQKSLIKNRPSNGGHKSRKKTGKGRK